MWSTRKKFVAVLMVCAAITGVTFGVPASASAHGDLSCDVARGQANHPNANCGKWSPNQAVLHFPWHNCMEVVTLSHNGPFGWFHSFDIQHCPSWH